MVRPPRGTRSHLGRPNRPSPSLRRGVSRGPLTRGPVRLLGPCFKTGRAGAQLRSATRGATCHLSAPAACRPSATTENSERRGDLRGTGGAAPEGAGAAHVPSSAARLALRCALLVLRLATREEGGTCAQAFGRPGLPVPSAAPGRSARIGRRRPDWPGPCGSETGRGRRPTR